jgi:cytochrome b6-f complex iron-sulfur subunit
MSEADSAPTPETPAEPRPEDRRGRRRFLATLGGLSAAWLGASLYPVYRYLGPRPSADPFDKGGRVPVEKVTPAEVARPGSGRNGAFAGRGLIVLRTPEGELRAFDAKCSHAGCNVEYQGDKLFCHCHGGTYDLGGRNIAGPPPRPLTPLRISEQDGALYVSRAAAPTSKG